MAILNFTIDEVITILKQNVNLPKQIKEVDSVGNQIKISLRKYFLTLDVFFGFNSFSQGKVYLNINAKWPTRHLLMRLFGSKLPKCYQVIGEMLVCDANGWLRQKLKGVQIQNIEASDNKFTITI